MVYDKLSDALFVRGEGVWGVVGVGGGGTHDHDHIEQNPVLLPTIKVGRFQHVPINQFTVHPQYHRPRVLSVVVSSVRVVFGVEGEVHVRRRALV